MWLPKSISSTLRLTTMLVVSIICLSNLVSSQSDIQIMNLEPPHHYIEKDLSTRSTKRNYVIRRALEQSILGHKPDFYSLFPKQNHVSRAAPPIIFDYANMIQNDIILLDDSIETNTRKRGSAAIMPPLARREIVGAQDGSHSCNCVDKVEWVYLGQDHFPQRYYYTTCKPDSACSALYKCRPIIYSITVLKRKSMLGPITRGLPKCLQADWVPEKIGVNVTCVCSDPD